MTTDEASEDGWRCQLELHLYPFPEPPTDASHLLTGVSVGEGRVEIWIERGPRLLIRVCPSSAKPYAFPTRPLIFKGNDHFEVALLCDDEKALLWINGQPAGSMLYPLPDAGPMKVCLPEWTHDQSEHPQGWRNDASKDAVEARRERQAATKSKPARRLLSEDELAASFAKEVSQIRELISLINFGSLDHIHGLAARVRSSCCYTKNRNDLYLLQHCASFRDIPLTVYTPPPHWAEHGNRADVELGGRIFPNRMAAGHVELDLDVWLCLPMFRHGNKEYSNNDVVRSFADTMDGAHHDKSVDPNIEEFFRHQGRAFGSIGTFDLMSSLVLELGFTVRVLGEKVLEALRFDSPSAGVLSK